MHINQTFYKWMVNLTRNVFASVYATSKDLVVAATVVADAVAAVDADVNATDVDDAAGVTDATDADGTAVGNNYQV